MRFKFNFVVRSDFICVVGLVSDLTYTSFQIKTLDVVNLASKSSTANTRYTPYTNKILRQNKIQPNDIR